MAKVNESPSVSIIMNCLNCAQDLPAALESVKNQTFRDYEIVFWDNNSTDNSAEIAKNSGLPLRYFKSDQTVPLGQARNRAIAQARGKYIAFLDCDDLWRPDKLSRQVALFERNPRVGLVCTDTEIFDGKRTLGRMFAKAEPEKGMVFAQLMKNQWISMSSAMVRRQALDELPGKPEADSLWFDDSLNVCEEADVFYRIAHDWELDFVDEPLTVWRVHGSNTTFKKFGRIANETLLILDKHRKLYPDYDKKHADIVELLTRRATFQQAVALWKDKKNAEARKTVEPVLGKGTKYRLFWLASFLPGQTFDLLARLYFALPGKLRG